MLNKILSKNKNNAKSSLILNNTIKNTKPRINLNKTSLRFNSSYNDKLENKKTQLKQYLQCFINENSKKDDTKIPKYSFFKLCPQNNENSSQIISNDLYNKTMLEISVDALTKKINETQKEFQKHNNCINKLKNDRENYYNLIYENGKESLQNENLINKGAIYRNKALKYINNNYSQLRDNNSLILKNKSDIKFNQSEMNNLINKIAILSTENKYKRILLKQLKKNISNIQLKLINSNNLNKK